MITVPIAYPGDDEFIAVVTRMRLAGAWDPQNDWLARLKGDPAWNKGRYAQFINDCVGYPRTVTPTSRLLNSGWVTCRALRERGFMSYKTVGAVQLPRYLIQKVVT